MFYSDSMLTKKGPLANIWLAAHWDKKLSKTQIVQTDINDSVHGILEGDLQNMALRLSGQLLLGVSKIYDRKARYLLEDCSDTVGRIKSAFKPGVHVDLPAEHTKAPKEAITLPAAATMDEFLMSEMELDIDELLRETTAASQMAKVDESAITLKPGLKGALNMKLGDEMMKEGGFGPLDEIPAEIDMDLEMGRRASDNLLRSDPLSIEAGRRDSTRLSEKLDSLQFSPMRTPTKPGLEDPFNDAPFHEYEMDYDMNPEMIPGGGLDPIEHPASEGAPVLPPSSPAAAEAVKKTPKARRQRKIHSALELDETTEISNAELQAILRDTALITVDLCKSQVVLSKNLFELPLVVPELNARSLGALFKTRPVTKPRETAAPTVPAAEEELPFHEYEMDYDGPTMDPLPPQTPLRDDPNDENRVPDDLNRFGNQTPLSGLQSPLKRLALSSPAKSVQSINSAATFSRNTIETLAIWKAAFQQAKGKSLDLEADLMVALAAGQPVNKRTAAGAFFEALVLRGKGMVTLKQDKPFAPIAIRANPGLFTAAATMIAE